MGERGMHRAMRATRAKAGGREARAPAEAPALSAAAWKLPSSCSTPCPYGSLHRHTTRAQLFHGQPQRTQNTARLT